MCLIEYRCTHCHKLLFKGVFTGTIQKKCPRCKTMNTFSVPSVPKQD